MKQKIHIIGAGISGLSLAKILSGNKDLEIHVYDSKDRAGGLIFTHNTSFGISESAANSILTTQPVLDFLRSCNAPLVFPQEASKKRFLFNERPRQWPLSFFETLSFIFKILSRLVTKGKQGFRPIEQESLEAWGHRCLGEKATQYILGPAMQGVYAGDLEKLSASLILGPIFNKKKNKYLGIVSGPSGMSDIIQAIYHSAIQAGVQFHFGNSTQLKNFPPSECVVIATSANEAVDLLKDPHPELSKSLSEIAMNSIVSTTCFFKEPQTKFKGFGCLIPRGVGLRTLGVLFNSYIFPNRDKFYNETYIMGGAAEGSVIAKSESEIIHLIQNERIQILKDLTPLTETIMFRWAQALPHYDLKLEEVLKKLVVPQGLYLHGNYLGGIGISKIIERSFHLSDEIQMKFKGDL